MPINLWRWSHVTPPHYVVLIQVSLGYPSARGSLPTRYSPVRRYPSLISAEAYFRNFPLDLHVLGTPPAFILSQDQTLNEMVSNGSKAVKPSLSFYALVERLRSFGISLYRNFCFFKELFVQELSSNRPLFTVVC